MARTADKPGTFRIIPKRDGSHTLSGVRANGTRVKFPGLSALEAQEMGQRLFPRKVEPTVELDEFGLPVANQAAPATWTGPTVSAETAAAVGLALGVKASEPAGAPKPKEDTPEERETKLKKARYAKSFMELAGICWATGDVWAARKITERAGCEPVNPNKEQVKDLKDATRDWLVDLFGDKEIKPWMMVLMLTFAIPASMLIQSPRKPKKVDEVPPLRSVPSSDKP